MKKIILILTILISGIVLAKSLELQRPENIDDKKWVGLKAVAEEVKLLPSGGGGVNHQFGTSVAVDGNRMIIGAPNYSLNNIKHGAVYVFNFDGIKWNESEILTPFDGQEDDQFGVSVSLSGSRLLIGASDDNDSGNDSGTVFVYDFDGAGWFFTQKITASDASNNDLFGTSVSLFANRALIGAIGNTGFSGSAYVFDFDGNNWNQTQKIRASDADATDVFGGSVSLSANQALIGASGDDGNGFASGAAYVFDFNGNSWSQSQKLTTADGGIGDRFGTSVSLSANQALIGAWADDDNGDRSGSAYLFDFNGSSWNQSQKIKAADAAAGDEFGRSVSLSTNQALIGTAFDDDNGDRSGSAYLFDFDGNSWNQIKKIRAADGAADDQFGFSVSLSANRAVIAAHRDDSNGINSGSVYVFDHDGNNWSQSHKILAVAGNGAAHDQFGISVSLFGPFALIGANSSSGRGSASVFSYDGSNWNQIQKIIAGDDANNGFGRSVSLYANLALIGAYQDDDNGNNSGSAYLFYFDGSSWIQTQKITAADGSANNKFGFSVSLSGHRALIGAYQDDDNGNRSGSAYVFDFDGSSWTQTQKITAADGSAGDQFGSSVSLYANQALIGAFLDDDNGSDSGAAYVFDFDGNSWTQTQKIIAIDGNVDDYFGRSVSLHANRALIGVSGDDDSSFNSGSAYIFEFDGSNWAQTQKIIATDGDIEDKFGVSVSLFGNQALIGASRDGDDGTWSGSAYLFDFDGSNWHQSQKLTASDAGIGDLFGVSVSLFNNQVLIGANGDDTDSGNGSGSAYVFIDDSIFTNGFEFILKSVVK